MQLAGSFTFHYNTYLVLEPLERSQRRLGLKNFDPCSILLNNDLSGGIPPILENLHEQYLLPPLHAGWAVRRKSTHFSCYDDVAKKFAKMVEIVGLRNGYANGYATGYAT